MIEPTNICNYRCPVCLTGGNYDKRARGNMKFSQFRKIIKPIKDSLKSINLWGFGEPFLAPDIIKMIDYLGKSDIFINIHTNGSVLTRKVMNRFKNNHKILLTFSIDGLTQKTYGHYRRGGNLNKVMDNLSYLTGLKRKYNLFNLQTIWQFIVMKPNEHEVDRVERAARKIGVDRLRFKTISVNRRHSSYNDLIPSDEKYRREGKKILNKNNCVFLFPGIPNVSWDGNVVPCCHDYLYDFVMGNAIKENIIDIWNSRQYKKFRSDYKKGINSLCNEKCKFTKKSRIYTEEIKFNQER